MRFDPRPLASDSDELHAEIVRLEALIDRQGRVELRVGDQAWALICRDPTGSKGRRTVEDACLVAISAIEGDEYRVTILRASHIPLGHERRTPRYDLYATFGDEHALFGCLISKFWNRRKEAA